MAFVAPVLGFKPKSHNPIQSYMAHFPPSVLPDQKDLLQGGSLFSGWLFDEATLQKIIEGHKSDMAVSANVSLASSFSKVIPAVLGRKTSASSDSSCVSNGF